MPQINYVERVYLCERVPVCVCDYVSVWFSLCVCGGEDVGVCVCVSYLSCGICVGMCIHTNMSPCTHVVVHVSVCLCVYQYTVYI